MKTLVLFGSPKRNGNTAYLLDEVQKNINGEIIFVNCYKDNISPCIDCGYCKTHPACIIQDDMQRVYDALAETDNIILASPIFFSELTGRVFDVISRLQALYYLKGFSKLKKKKGVAILTGGGDGDAQPAKSSADRLLKIMQAKHVKQIYSLNTDNVHAADDCEAMEQATIVAEWLNKEGTE